MTSIIRASTDGNDGNLSLRIVRKERIYLLFSAILMNDILYSNSSYHHDV